MAESKPGKKSAQESAKSRRSDATFTDEERAAMREYVRERKAAVRGPRSDKADGETAVLEKIKAMAAPDRAIGERLHAIVRAAAPALAPKLWYGMPAYANQDGNVVCFFQCAQKFKTRYATLGFSDKAHLDEGRMWPTAFALKELGAAEAARVGELVTRAAG